MIWAGLFISYLSLAVLLLGLNISSRWSLRIRLVAVVLVSALYAVTWLGLGALRGWPTDEVMPAEFRLNWVQVNEPDKSTGATGAIYFWVREIDVEGHPANEPRSFSLPFDAETAKSATEAQEELMSGVKLNGYLTRGLIDPEEGRAEHADAAGGSGGQSEDGDTPRFEFRTAPAPTLPPKGIPGSDSDAEAPRLHDS